MSTYTVVIYISFAVFILTVLILNTSFFPQMSMAGTSIINGSSTASSVLPVSIQANIIPTIQTLFIISVVIHAMGDGILAGVLENGRISSGMKHSFIMLVIGLIGMRVL